MCLLLHLLRLLLVLLLHLLDLGFAGLLLRYPLVVLLLFLLELLVLLLLLRVELLLLLLVFLVLLRVSGIWGSGRGCGGMSFAWIAVGGEEHYSLDAEPGCWRVAQLRHDWPEGYKALLPLWPVDSAPSLNAPGLGVAAIGGLP